jgi:hypothetical protein
MEEQAQRLESELNKALNRLVPFESCPLRKQKAEWKKAELVKILVKNLIKKYEIDT